MFIVIIFMIIMFIEFVFMTKTLRIEQMCPVYYVIAAKNFIESINRIYPICEEES